VLSFLVDGTQAIDRGTTLALRYVEKPNPDRRRNVKETRSRTALR
jgi:hypothetical protein